MELYTGIDLHSNNAYVGICDREDRRVYQRRLPNMADVILAELEPYKEKMAGVVVESTYNWYWLVDSLADHGYRVHLANPAAIQQYKGLKYAGDRHDAFWLAHLLRLGILPEGYIYPKERRPIRDLLRKRGHLVRLRTSLINSLQGIISRNCGSSLNAGKIKQFKEDHVAAILADKEDIQLSGEISKETIDYLTRQIRKTEAAILERVKLEPPFAALQTIPGIGKILGLTIMLETGDPRRFAKVGAFASYCRKVPTGRESNGKKKGNGNAKNGNKYLAWAFSEAAEMARRYDDKARAFYNRKAAKTNFMVAHTALAHKLCRAAWQIMSKGVAYDQEKLFA